MPFLNEIERAVERSRAGVSDRHLDDWNDFIETLIGVDISREGN